MTTYMNLENIMYRNTSSYGELIEKKVGLLAVESRTVVTRGLCGWWILWFDKCLPKVLMLKT
jgi:hypothetical protein